MSYRIRDIATIHNNPLNCSISKQLYTIPKANRFQHNKTEASQKFYDLPPTNSKKAAPFNHAERKSIFDVQTKIPSPDRYNIKIPHDQTHPISFAKGRSQIKVLNFLKTNQNPGPGAYNPNPQFIDPLAATKYTIRARTQNSQRQTIAPGPGKYTLKTSWLQKDKFLSNDKKVGCPLIRPSKSKRQIAATQQTTADVPLYYPTKTKKGQETFNKTGGFSIGKSIRFVNKVKTQIPGPGAYNRFSQFV